MNYTEDEKIACVKDYIKSGLSQPAYHRSNLDIGFRTFKRWIAKYRHDNILLDGEHLTKRTVHIDSLGNIKQQWLKPDNKLDNTKELLKAFADGFKDDIPRAEPSDPFTIDYLADVLNLFTLTDAHVGMRTEGWNMEIAEIMIKGWIDRAVDACLPAHTAIFNIQGDATHWDSLKPTTPASGHVLDADCNSREMGRLIIKLVRYCIKKMLTKHKNVHVKWLVGNHDEYTAVLSSEWLDVFYEDEPRVTVDTENELFHVFEWGQNALFFHHGHKRTIKTAVSTFIKMFKEIYGRCKFAVGHIGHFHHEYDLPKDLMDMFLHPTLAAPDDYSRHAGHVSNRAAFVFSYHKEYGEIERSKLTPAMIMGMELDKQ